MINTDCIWSCKSIWTAITAKTNDNSFLSTHMTYYFSWVYIRVNKYWHIEQRTLKKLYPLTKLKLTRFCDYILLNQKFSGECFVALFFSTLAFVLCVVCHSVNYIIWLPFFPLCCLSFCELRHMITLCVVCHMITLLLSSDFSYDVFDEDVCFLSFIFLFNIQINTNIHCS
jgi:hypothetical protein